MPVCLITGSAGLVGSEAVRFYAAQGWKVIGIDNDTRSELFGTPKGKAFCHPHYTQVATDIRDFDHVSAIVKENRPDLVIHAAAQPSHDWSAKDPLTDFEINARGTLNMLEACRVHAPEAVFIQCSTNKVLGSLSWVFLSDGREYAHELPTRYEIYDSETGKPWAGFDETFGIDQVPHSIFGASKASADLMVQEYAHVFGLKTGVFRCGCLTGPAHAGAEAHGFLAYMIQQLMNGGDYNVIGYAGKQVRDQLAASDLISAFDEFYRNPKPGVFIMGGGRGWEASVIESISMAELIADKKLKWTYKDEPRRFDHQWYCSCTAKFERMYPNWKRQKTLETIVKEIVEAKRIG